MPDNSWQANLLCRQGDALLTRYERDPNTFVGINVQLRYREGADTRALVPDVFVVFGVPAGKRSSYSVWEEGKSPDFVLEVASQGTYRKDLGSKKSAYEEMGVPEYGVFDPKGDMHRPRLQLFRLEDGAYQRVSGRSGPDGSLAVASETLGLELRLEDDRLRLWDPEVQEYLLNQHEERAGTRRNARAASRSVTAASQLNNERVTLKPNWRISRNGFREAPNPTLPGSAPKALETRILEWVATVRPYARPVYVPRIPLPSAISPYIGEVIGSNRSILASPIADPHSNLGAKFVPSAHSILSGTLTPETCTTRLCLAFGHLTPLSHVHCIDPT